ncbi:hypothetical protein E2C01_080523 [Portunus trituberculatus]|uniref:Uncharacterized protein n=1 Tax=Portunus trituberculatus TaxID=210409 RepID=A0A5B7ITH3_PORTR|nr:hypothetical protein [Portunus trituberculatus]
MSIPLNSSGLGWCTYFSLRLREGPGKGVEDKKKEKLKKVSSGGEGRPEFAEGAARHWEHKQGRHPLMGWIVDTAQVPKADLGRSVPSKLHTTRILEADISDDTDSEPD